MESQARDYNRSRTQEAREYGGRLDERDYKTKSANNKVIVSVSVVWNL